MVGIAITGAAGRIGTEAIQELTEHVITAVDVEPVAEPEHVTFERIDVTDGVDPLEAVFEGREIVIHLAAHADPYQTWPEILQLNIDGTYNVFEAAARSDVDRVVFASSNHVTHMKNIENPTAPETMVADPAVVHPDGPTYADSYYGVSKVAGEGLANYYATVHGIEFVNLRIGWYLTPEQLAEYQDEPEAVARYARAMYLSPRDCREILHRAVTESISENPLTVNVISENRDRYLSLAKTIRELNYQPRDDSTDVLS